MRIKRERFRMAVGMGGERGQKVEEGVAVTWERMEMDIGKCEEVRCEG